MAAVTGVDKLVAKFKKAAGKFGGDVDGVVGYTQAYGVYVHEDLEAHHPVGKAKFLEDPLREGKDYMEEIIAEAVKKGRTLKQAITLALLWLQRQSMMQCPVDTGALRASAFTEVKETSPGGAIA